MYLYLCVAFLFVICSAQEDVVLISEETVLECKDRNGYTNVEGSCDAYVECVDYQPFKMLCPDGLNYNPKTRWPMYPCNYPSDVPCVGRDTSQPAKPTDDCPHQYGFFQSPLSTANHCGHYRMCAEGHAYDMNCPIGLAFDPVQARCEWPDLVPGCNSEDFIGFICPVAEYDQKGNSLTVNFKHETGCKMFYSCQAGRARLLSCDPGFAFDEKFKRCVEEEFVDCVSDPGSNSKETETADDVNNE